MERTGNTAIDPCPPPPPSQTCGWASAVPVPAQGPVWHGPALRSSFLLAMPSLCVSAPGPSSGSLSPSAQSTHLPLSLRASPPLPGRPPVPSCRASCKSSCWPRLRHLPGAHLHRSSLMFTPFQTFTSAFPAGFQLHEDRQDPHQLVLSTESAYQE